MTFPRSKLVNSRLNYNSVQAGQGMFADLGCRLPLRLVRLGAKWEALGGVRGDSWGSSKLGQAHVLLKSWNLIGQRDL